MTGQRGKIDLRARDMKLALKIESEVLKLLENKDLTPEQRLKAIDAAARVLAIRHKLNDDGGGGEGSFFSK